MASVGTVRELWRYPVKSMGGESLAHATLGAMGIPGDRGWAVRDEAAREIRGGKKLPQLMQCRARYVRARRRRDPAGREPRALPSRAAGQVRSCGTPTRTSASMRR